jgi:hypothetical protein
MVGGYLMTNGRRVAGQPPRTSDWGGLVGWPGALGQARDVADGAFRRHMTAIVPSVAAAAEPPSAARPDKQGARLTHPRRIDERPEGWAAADPELALDRFRPVIVLQRAAGHAALATAPHRFDLTWPSAGQPLTSAPRTDPLCAARSSSVSNYVYRGIGKESSHVPFDEHG